VILIDSSAWIEYYHPRGNETVQKAVAEVIESDEAATNGIIRVEIVGFARNERTKNILENDFSAFHDIDLVSETFALACDLGVALRRYGITVPATDLIIASTAIQSSATLYHLDKHFDQIAMYSDLKSINFLK
jgi:predicted nucleic acid-binding protein